MISRPRQKLDYADREIDCQEAMEHSEENRRYLRYRLSLKVEPKLTAELALLFTAL